MAPMCTPPIPPVAKTRIPAAWAAIIVAATVVAPHSPDAIASPRFGRDDLPDAPPRRGREGLELRPRASPTMSRPSLSATVAGTAPEARTAASDAVATSTFCGYGSPWLMRVDSRATTGRPSRSASATSGAMARRSAGIMRGGYVGWAARRTARRALSPGRSSPGGVDRCRSAVRLPSTAPRWRAAVGATPRRSASSQPARNPASNASPAPVVSAGWIGVVATSNRRRSPPSRTRIVAPFAAALDDGDRGEVEDVPLALAPRSARPRRRSRTARSGAARQELERRLAPAGEQRRGARRGPRRPARRPPWARSIAAQARVAQRAVEQRVGGEMERVGALEPGRPEVLGPEPEGGAALGDERALPGGVDDHADPAGPLAGDAHGPDGDPVGGERGHERTARRVPPHRADERRPGAEPAQPPRGRRRRAALAEPRPEPGHVAAALQLAVRGDHDVEHEVAEHDDVRPVRVDAPGRRRRGAGSRRRRAAGASSVRV